MAVALLVVEHRAALQRVLDARQRDALLAELGGRVRRQLERVERGAGVALAAQREERQTPPPRPPRSPPRASTVGELLGGERGQRIHPQAREQGAVDLERGVLGGGADQRQQALLHGRQQRVLLGLVEAVDLVEEQHRPAASGSAPVGRALDHRTDLRAPGLHRAELLEGAAGALGDDPREGRLAGSRRAVEEHRVGLAVLDRRAQGGARRPAGGTGRRSPSRLSGLARTASGRSIAPPRSAARGRCAARAALAPGTARPGPPGPDPLDPRRKGYP